MANETVRIYDQKGQARDVPKSLATPENMNTHGYSFQAPQQQSNIPSNPGMSEQGNSQPVDSREAFKKQLLQQYGGPQQALMKAAEWVHKRPGLDKAVTSAANFLEPVGNASKGAVLGGVEGLADTASSVGNIPIEIANLIGNTNIPTMGKANLQRYLPQNSSAANLGFQGGDIAGQLLGGGEAFNAAGMIPKLGNEASVLQNVGRGAIAGGATGENAPGGRLSGTVGGAALGPANQLTNKALTQNLFNKQGQAYGQAQNMYNKTFEPLRGEASNFVPKGEYDALKGHTSLGEGAQVIPSREIDLGRIRKNIPKEERTAIENFSSNPTMENAHYAQSELGAKIRKLKLQEATDSNFKKGNLIRSLTKDKISIKTALGESLMKSGKQNYDNYNAAQEFYEKYVIPYSSKGILQKRKSNDIFDSDVINKMTKNAKFMQSAPGKENSMLRTRALINSLLNKKNIVPASVLGAVGLNQYDKRSAPSAGLYGDQ